MKNIQPEKYVFCLQKIAGMPFLAVFYLLKLVGWGGKIDLYYESCRKIKEFIIV